MEAVNAKGADLPAQFPNCLNTASSAFCDPLSPFDFIADRRDAAKTMETGDFLVPKQSLFMTIVYSARNIDLQACDSDRWQDMIIFRRGHFSFEHLKPSREHAPFSCCI
jgi:hypothetical protein